MLSPVRRLTVVEDCGEIGKGTSQPHRVRADDGREYLMKGGDLAEEPRHYHFIAANELIAARLASELGLPVLDCCVLEGKDGRLYFGSRFIDDPIPEWLRDELFYITEERLENCANREVVYGLVVFDSWICNQDRNVRSFLTRPDKTGIDGKPLHLYLNDHGNSLVLPGCELESLDGLRNAPPGDRFVKDNICFLRQAITSCEKLASAIERLERLPDEQVVAIVEDTPDELLTPGERPAYALFLLHRKNCIRELFRTAVGVRFFERLDGSCL